MRDRQPTPGQEGRMLITPENGSAPFYAKVNMADNPLHEGTPLTTATLLDDVTAGLFGFSKQAVPNDVLRKLSDLYLHGWRRHEITEQPSYSLGAMLDMEYNYQQGVTIRYAAAINVDYMGRITLVNPATITITTGSGPFEDALDTVKGKFIQIGGTQSNWDMINVEKRGTANAYYSDGTKYAAQSVTGNPVKTDPNFDFVFAKEESSFPKNGIDGNYLYHYVGIPFDNAVQSPRISFGSYVGTNTYGKGNPNSVTLPFPPDYILFLEEGISASKYPYNYYNMHGLNDSGRPYINCGILETSYSEETAYGKGPNGMTNSLASGSEQAWKSEDGKTIYWFSAQNQVAQLNIQDNIYYYMAVGKGGLV